MIVLAAGIEGNRELNFGLKPIREGNNQHGLCAGQEELRIGPDGVIFFQILHSGLFSL